MRALAERMGVVSYLLIGMGLFLLGLLALGQLINNFWPIDVQRLDLIRATALDQSDAPALLQAANTEIILAFLAVELVAVTGLGLPLAYFLNQRFGRPTTSHYLVPLRQAVWLGLWVAFCTWLQMNRTLGWAVAALVAVVLILFEILLQVRTHTAAVASSQKPAVSGQTD